MSKQKWRKKTLKVEAIFSVMIAVIFFVALIPTIVSQVQDVSIIDTTTWNFTGHSGAATIFLLIPFVVIAAFALGLVLKLIGRATPGV